MSKLFYDHLTLVGELWQEIDELALTEAEKKTAKQSVDVIFHHRVLTVLLDLLPKEHHDEFLARFYKQPYDVAHLSYLIEKTGKNVHEEIVVCALEIKGELLHHFKKHARKK